MTKDCCDECGNRIGDSLYYRIYECLDEYNWLGHLLNIKRKEVRMLCSRCFKESGL